MARHDRRKETNAQHFEEVQLWCEHNGWSVEVKNHGHHWIFHKEGTLAEWWPSSAKCVLNKHWRKGIHVHDWRQMIDVLRQTRTRFKK